MRCLVVGVLLFLVAVGARAESNSWNMKSWGEKRPDFRRKKAAKAESASAQQSSEPATPLLYNDILLGLKGGFRESGYTDVTIDGQSRPRTKGPGYTLGVSVYWALGWPRLEADVLMNTRKQGDRSPVGYVGLPLLIKFSPAENRLLTWELGTGLQTDVAITGGGSRRGVLLGMPLVTDLLIDLGGVYVTAELRYSFGLLTYDTDTTGGRPRDFDLMIGVQLPIDRE